LIYALWSCEALGSLQIDIASPPTKSSCVRYWLLGDRVSTVNCHKQLVAFIRNAFSNTCLVFNKTKMDFMVIVMKGLT